VKRLLVLVLVIAGGLVAAAFLVPTNAADVNGTTISQQSLSSDVSAIAGSAPYQCYLNSQEYLSSNGAGSLPAVTGAGKTENADDHPTATSAFVATYLDTEIGHQLVQQVAAKQNVTVTPAQLADARAAYAGQISSVMSATAQTQNPRLTCGAAVPLTGPEVLQTLPASFVNAQVQFVATASVLQEQLSGVGASDADLARYYSHHRSGFDRVCVTVAGFSTQAEAQTAATKVASGTPFSQVASQAQGGPRGCGALPVFASQLPSTVNLGSLPVNAVSAPISAGGGYFLLQFTSRTATPFSSAKPYVEQAVQRAGSTATQKAITAAERQASVRVDPRYGVWVPVQASVFTPLTPSNSDVLNPSANQAGVAPAAAGSNG
jgi:hypothetical protein